MIAISGREKDQGLRVWRRIGQTGSSSGQRKDALEANLRISAHFQPRATAALLANRGVALKSRVEAVLVKVSPCIAARVP